jgi:4-aminobutyrate aminotransferase
MGDYLVEGLRALKEKFAIVGNIAGKGLHLGIDLVRDPQTKERAFAEAEKIMYRCMDQGIALKVIEGNILTIRPALCINRDECDWIIDALDRSLSSL